MKTGIMRIVVGSLSIVLSGVFALANTPNSEGGTDQPNSRPSKKVTIATELEDYGVTGVEYKPMTAEEMAAFAKKPLAPRKIAQAGFDFETRLAKNPEFTKFREKFFAIKYDEKNKQAAVGQVDKLLRELQNNYGTYKTPEMQLLASQLIPLRAWKGFVFRFRPLAEKANIVHSMLLTGVMNFAGTMRFYFPTQQNEALFAYVSEPYEFAIQFKEADDLQEWVEKALYPLSVQAASRMMAIDVRQPVVWDGKFFNSEATFDGIDRYSLFGESEKNVAMAGFHQGMSWMTSFLAYETKGLIQLTKKVGNLYGMDGFPLFGGVSGVPIEERVKEVRNHPEVFAKNRDAKKWLGQSLTHLKEGVVYAKSAWTDLERGGESEVSMLNPIVFQGMRRGISSNLPEIEKMLQGPTVLVSRISGQKVRVNVPVLFTSPRDLQDMMPVAPFSKDRSYTKDLWLTDKKGDQYNEPVLFRDYFSGRALNWKTRAYSDWAEVYDSKANKWVPVRNGKDIQSLQQVMSQSWGGTVVALPLAGAML